MMMRKLILLFISVVISTTIAYSQDTSKILIPEFQDQYVAFVKQLEAGDTTINFEDFRFSLLESKQLAICNKHMEDRMKLKKQMIQASNDENHQLVIQCGKALLGYCYIEAIAHRRLIDAYIGINDLPNAKKHQAILKGMLFSIKSSGDGQSSETGYKVSQVDEEYFILGLIGAKLISQSVVNSNNGQVCDKMDVEIPGKGQGTIYFNITKLFESHEKLFK